MSSFFFLQSKSIGALDDAVLPFSSHWKSTALSRLYVFFEFSCSSIWDLRPKSLIHCHKQSHLLQHSSIIAKKLVALWDHLGDECDAGDEQHPMRAHLRSQGRKRGKQWMESESLLVYFCAISWWLAPAVVQCTSPWQQSVKCLLLRAIPMLWDSVLAIMEKLLFGAAVRKSWK